MKFSELPDSTIFSRLQQFQVANCFPFEAINFGRECVFRGDRSFSEQTLPSQQKSKTMRDLNKIFRTRGLNCILYATKISSCYLISVQSYDFFKKIRIWGKTVIFCTNFLPSHQKQKNCIVLFP